MIMFCKELFISGTDEDFLSVREIFENVLAKEDRPEDCRKNIACVLARIYRLTNAYNKFFKICLKDMAQNPCAEICMELGHYFYGLKDYEEAVLWYLNAASETPRRRLPVFQNVTARLPHKPNRIKMPNFLPLF